MTSRLATLALATLVLLAGCATHTPTESSRTGSPPPTTSPAPAPSGSAVPGDCERVQPAVTVSDADDGATVCLTVGGELTLSLPGAGWQTPVVQGDVLVPNPASGGTSVPRFRVRRPGSDTVIAARRSCPAGQAARSCHALRAYQIHVIGVAG